MNRFYKKINVWFTLPAVALFIIVVLIPFFMGLVYSFTSTGQVADGLADTKAPFSEGGGPLAHGLFRRARAEHHHHKEPEYTAFDERAQR